MRHKSFGRPVQGPLHVSAANPRYFADGDGNVVYLTGSHTWNNLQDWGASNPPPRFDYSKYLAFLAVHGHNFFRLFNWEQAAWVPWTSEMTWFAPMPYLRTGPGEALDRQPRFDLHKWNPEYFRRLRERVEEASRRGIYVAVMLFNGWSVGGKRAALSNSRRHRGVGNPWRGHPFNRLNNVHDFDGDAGGEGEGSEVHSLSSPAVVELQKAYVRKIIDTVGDLDNVLWEISNESNLSSTAWEYEMIRFVKQVEAERPKQHPVGMTAEFPNGRNEDLFDSPADWVSPASTGSSGYAIEPPSAVGNKVLVSDTDHIWGLGGSADWVWKTFTRGINTLFMDPYEADVTDFYPRYANAADAGYQVKHEDHSEWDAIRRSLGYTNGYALKMSLAGMTPRGELASTGYCLADPGLQYLVYAPEKYRTGERLLRSIPSSRFPETVRVNLSGLHGKVDFEWFHPASGKIVSVGGADGGRERTFAAPIRGGGLVLYIHSGSAYNQKIEC
jgi:hypothetical protein